MTGCVQFQTFYFTIRYFAQESRQIIKRFWSQIQDSIQSLCCLEKHTIINIIKLFATLANKVRLYRRYPQQKGKKKRELKNSHRERFLEPIMSYGVYQSNSTLGDISCSIRARNGPQRTNGVNRNKQNNPEKQSYQIKAPSIVHSPKIQSCDTKSPNEKYPK